MSESSISKPRTLKDIARGSFFLGITLGLGAYCLNNLIKDFSLSWNQKTTEARVLSVEEGEENTDERTIQVFFITYSYTTPLGQYFEGYATEYDEPQSEVIIIDYDSSSPENSRLHKDDSIYYQSSRLVLVGLFALSILWLNIRFLWKEIITYYQVSFEIQNANIRKLKSRMVLFLLVFMPLYVLVGLASVRLLTYNFPAFIKRAVWMPALIVGGGIYLWLWLRESYFENLILLSVFVLWFGLMFVSLNLNDLYPQQFSESSENVFLLLSFLSGIPISFFAGCGMRKIERRRRMQINFLAEQSQETREVKNQTYN